MGMSKDQMTSGYLTHELRAPLTAIRCSLELLLEKTTGALEREDQEILAIALRNTSKLNLLINDIMEISKIQTGRLAMSPASVDLVALARETVEDLAPWARRKGLTMTLRAADKCPPALADGRRTVQSLTNLISNAIKFTPSGGSIEVALEEGKGDHAGYVVVSVKDTGCGIAPENIRKVFGYFVQVGPQEQKGEGNGLGLSLARSMIEIQGGVMWVTSRFGEGAVFSFTVPVYVQPPVKVEK
jgi:signal transduction histidine kinase